MWTLPVIVVTGICLSVWFMQFVCAWRYTRQFHADESRARPEPTDWPKFYVFMPLRGPDPHLPAAIRAILQQDYPDVELRIVVDHPGDPAMQLVEEALREVPAAKVHVDTLRECLPTCSLVCSSIVQFFDDLEDDCGLFTLIPADVIAPPNWLRTMATIMADPKIGTTLGNRWYQPVEGRWGSLLRYCWNAGAVVPMWLLEIPWGGAWALRPEDVRSADFDRKWRSAMAEDAPLKNGLRKLGLGLGFDPQLIAANREETSAAGCFNFVKRQMLWTRLYHPAWWNVLGGSILTAAVMFLPLLAAGVAAVLQAWTAAGVLLGVFIAYLAGQLVLLMLLERAIGGMLRRRGEPAMHISPGLLVRLLAAIPATQVMYLGAIFDCLVRRELTWRGIRYVVKGPWDAIMTGHTPYQAQSQPDAGANVSLH